MKQTSVLVVVIVVVSAIGLAGFWIGRSSAPTSQTKNEIPDAPTGAQSTPSVAGAVEAPKAAEQEKVAPKRLQSTYVPQSDTSDKQPDATATPANKKTDQPINAQLGNRFEYPLVLCGQDLCEIQAASFFGGDSEADQRDFQTVENTMPLQPWWATLQFDQFASRFSSSKNGRVLAIVMVTRK